MQAKKVGRPSDYSTKIAELICERLMDGESVRSICRDEDMPCRTTVFKWLAANPEFADRYARAREIQADMIFEELFEIADDGRNDWMEKFDKDGKSLGYMLNGEHVQRSRLRIDARKWALARMSPAKYGERVDVNHGGQADNPISALLKLAQGTALPFRGDMANDSVNEDR